MLVAHRVLTAGLLLALGVNAVPAQGKAPPSKHLVTSSGHQLALWEKGPPQPKGAIVLVHGRTWSSLPDFDLQVPGEKRSLMDALVIKGYAVYALDLRGYGATARDASGWNSPNQAADDLAEALRWIMKSSGISGKPVVFGWSNGATVAHLAAQKTPELMSSLILFGYWKDPDSLVTSGPDTVTPLRAKTTAVAAASDFIRPEAISKKAIDVYVAAAIKTDSIRSDWRRLEEYNALSPAKLKVPTLLITGEFDPLAPAKSQEKFFKRLAATDKRWVTIKGGDHAALIEDMQPEFVATMVSFIERKQTVAKAPTKAPAKAVGKTPANAPAASAKAPIKPPAAVPPVPVVKKP